MKKMTFVGASILFAAVATLSGCASENNASAENTTATAQKPSCCGEGAAQAKAAACCGDKSAEAKAAGTCTKAAEAKSN